MHVGRRLCGLRDHPQIKVRREKGGKEHQFGSEEQHRPEDERMRAYRQRTLLMTTVNFGDGCHAF